MKQVQFREHRFLKNKNHKVYKQQEKYPYIIKKSSKKEQSLVDAAIRAIINELEIQ